MEVSKPDNSTETSDLLRRAAAGDQETWGALLTRHRERLRCMVALRLDPFERLAEAFLARYRAGERPSVSEYVRRHPELAEQIRELFPALVLMEELRPGGGEPTARVSREYARTASRANPWRGRTYTMIPVRVSRPRETRNFNNHRGRKGKGRKAEIVDYGHVLYPLFRFRGLLRFPAACPRSPFFGEK
jgi:hypothetical protein